MASVTRASIAKQLVPGLNAIVGLEYKGVDNEHVPLFDVDNSQRAYEEEVMMSGFDVAPEKSEGAAVQYDYAQETYTARYTNITRALAFSIAEEAMEDGLYATQGKLKSKALGRAMAAAKQTAAANIYNNGFSTAAADLGGDGAALFSASHPTVSAGSLSNTVSADLSETALENALISISQFKDERGILIGCRALSLHVPPQLMFAADRILRSERQSGTANNDVNALRSMGMFPKGIFTNHRFTDTNAWFIRTDVPNGMKMFVRTPLVTKNEGDFETGNFRFKARERYSFGWTDWRGAYGSNGSS